MLDLKMWHELMKQMNEALKPWMELLGLEMYVDRVELQPDDCPDTCIDYVWRITCKDPEVCEKLREEIRKQASGEAIGGGGEEEEKE